MQVLELRTEAPDVLNALSTLSSFYETNSAAERKHLRATIERRGVSINAEYLAAAESVMQVKFALQSITRKQHNVAY